MLEREQMVAPYLDREQFLTVRYQDLVLNPKEVCRQLYEFLGCGFLPSYLHYARETDPYPDRWGWVPEASQQFNVWHTSKWREQMSQEQIRRVDETAGWFMDKYGYER